MSEHSVARNLVAEYVTDLVGRDGWNKRKLATVTGIDPSYVTRMVKGERNASAEVLKKMADQTGVPLPPELLAVLPPEGPAQTAGMGLVDVPLYTLIPAAGGGAAYRSNVVSDRAPRLPGIIHARDVMAVRMPDDSMSPWRQPSEMIYLQPGWAVARGDHVLAELPHPTDPDSPNSVFVVRQVAQIRQGELTLATYDGAAPVKLRRGEYLALTRVMEWSELTAAR